MKPSMMVKYEQLESKRNLIQSKHHHLFFFEKYLFPKTSHYFTRHTFLCTSLEEHITNRMLGPFVVAFTNSDTIHVIDCLLII